MKKQRVKALISSRTKTLFDTFWAAKVNPAYQRSDDGSRSSYDH